MAGSLCVTEHYGPKQLKGELRTMPMERRYQFTPNVNVLGTGGGGVGVDTVKKKIHSSRWLFTGQLLPAKDKPGRNSIAYGAVYRRLKWELTENDLEARSLHSNIIHTGFALEHECKPFYLHVEIDGKLKSVKDRIMKHMKFSSASRENQGAGMASTLINLGSGRQYQQNLDDIAAGLPMAMELANMETVSLQIPEALPASFKAVENSSSNRTSGVERLSYQHDTNGRIEVLNDKSQLPLPTSALSMSQVTNDPLFKILSAAPATFSNQIEQHTAPTSGLVDTSTPNDPVVSAGVSNETGSNSLMVPSTATSSESADPPSVFSISNSIPARKKPTNLTKETNAQDILIRLNKSPYVLLFVGLFLGLLDLLGKIQAPYKKVAPSTGVEDENNKNNTETLKISTTTV